MEFLLKKVTLKIFFVYKDACAQSVRSFGQKVASENEDTAEKEVPLYRFKGWLDWLGTNEKNRLLHFG